MSGAAEKTAHTGGDLTIRPLRPGDRAAWGALWQGYLAFYETELPEAVHDNTFARLLEGAGDGPHGFLAERDGRAVGLVHYIFHAHCWRPEGICYLQDLFAVPEARGTGVGRALIEAVYAAADARGVPGVYWLTQEFNAPARRLYDRIGEATPFIKYVREA